MVCSMSAKETGLTVTAAPLRGPTARSPGRRARPLRSGRAPSATGRRGARRVSRALPSAAGRVPHATFASRAVSAAASTASALSRAVSDIRVDCCVCPSERSDRDPAGGCSHVFEGTTCPGRLGLCMVQRTDGRREPLGRSLLLQTAHAEHRVEAEPVGLHVDASSSGTRFSSSSVVLGSELISPTGCFRKASMAGRSLTARSTRGLVPGT